MTNEELAFAKLLQEAGERIKQDLEDFKRKQQALFRANPAHFVGCEIDAILAGYAERDFSFL